MTTLFKVCTYNILSSKLANAVSYPDLAPEVLDRQVRYEKLQQELLELIEENYVICLQEVSSEWKNQLIPFFINHQYHLIYSSYGNRFNDYMGVGIAFPTTMDLLQVRILKPVNSKRWVEEPPRSKLNHRA